MTSRLSCSLNFSCLLQSKALKGLQTLHNHIVAYSIIYTRPLVLPNFGPIQPAFEHLSLLFVTLQLQLCNLKYECIYLFKNICILPWQRHREKASLLTLATLIQWHSFVRIALFLETTPLVPISRGMLEHL